MGGFEVQELVGRVFSRDLEAAIERLLEQAEGHRDQKQNRLTATAYKEMGYLMGALNQYVTDWYETLTEKEQGLVRLVMLALVRTGVDTKDMRWRRELSTILDLGGKESADIIDSLTEQRLIVQDKRKVDLIHEKIIDGWKLFSKWRQSDREIRPLVNRLEDSEEEWKNHGCQDDFLLSEDLVKQIHLKQGSIEQYLRAETLIFLQKSYQYHHFLQEIILWTQSETASMQGQKMCYGK